MSNGRSTRQQIKKATARKAVAPKKHVESTEEKQPTGPPPVSDRGVLEAMRNELNDLVTQLTQARENKLYLVARLSDLETENATLRAALAELDATPKT